MPRHNHVLKLNEQNETPANAVFVGLDWKTVQVGRRDVEYVLDGCHIILARQKQPLGYWTHQNFTVQSARAAWSYITQFCRVKTRTWLVIAHAAIALVLLKCFEVPEEFGWTLKNAVIENPPTILKWRTDQRSLQLVDVANFWPEQSTNSYAGKKIGPESKPINGPEPLSNALPADRQALSLYHQMQTWWSFLRVNNLGNFQPTAASQAMSTYRHRFMKDAILIDTHEPALKLAREAYKGARVECYKIGKMYGEFYLLDVNSMYAAVMSAMRVPTWLISYSERTTLDELRRHMESRCCIARCTIQTQLPVFAVKHHGRLVFPTGRFQACLADTEIEYALRHNLVQDVQACATYRPKQAFTDFVRALWNERILARSRGDNVSADGFKLLLQSFSGKWGQSGNHWVDAGAAMGDKVRQWADINYQTKEVIEYREFAGLRQVKAKDAESFASHPAIAACITAGARMLLWDLIQTAGQENTFYVDTDSLLVNDTGLQRLEGRVEPHVLGGLRLEGTYRNVEIRTSKNYTFDNRVRHAGIGRLSTFDEAGRSVEVQLQSLAAMINDGDLSRVKARRVSKTFNHIYDKGVIDVEGRVRPFEFTDRRGRAGDIECS